MNDREAIPEPMKREVRVRCGFGCVICGAPVYHYDHIHGIKVTGHVADEITLLCPSHHHEKTVGRLPVSMVEAADADPINLRTGRTRTHQLHLFGENLRLELGSLRIEALADHQSRIRAIQTDGGVVIGFRLVDGAILFDLKLRDADNRVLVRIDRSEVQYVSDLWDVTFEGRRLTIRSTDVRPILRMSVHPDESRIVIDRLSAWANGIHFVVGSRGDFWVVNRPFVVSGVTIQTHSHAFVVTEEDQLFVGGHGFGRVVRHLGGYGSIFKRPFTAAKVVGVDHDHDGDHGGPVPRNDVARAVAYATSKR